MYMLSYKSKLNELYSVQDVVRNKKPCKKNTLFLLLTLLQCHLTLYSTRK